MENNTTLQQQLLEAGVHFGHLRKKWNPKMLPYIYAEKKGIHIIDLNKTVECLQETAIALKNIAKSGKKIMFVGTKKQAKEIVTECAKRINMPFVTERWLGGMLTNFNTIRRRIDRMIELDRMEVDGTFERLTKKEVLTLRNEKERLLKFLRGIREMKKIPDAIYIVDPRKERIAVAEARKLDIPVIAILDTNCDPDEINYLIPGNDDAIRAVKLITAMIADAVLEGKQISETPDVEEQYTEVDDEKPEFDEEIASEKPMEKETTVVADSALEPAEDTAGIEEDEEK